MEQVSKTTRFLCEQLWAGGSSRKSVIRQTRNLRYYYFPHAPASSYASRDLIRGLLSKDPQHRLGLKRGATEINHPFFEGVIWALITAILLFSISNSNILTNRNAHHYLLWPLLYVSRL